MTESSRPGSREVIDFLQASPVFAGLPARELESLAAAAREEPCRAREYVFHEGDAALWLYLVKTGRVRIVRHSRTGKDVVLELLGSGEIFGGVAVIERRPYPAAAQATEPSANRKPRSGGEASEGELRAGSCVTDLEMGRSPAPRPPLMGEPHAPAPVPPPRGLGGQRCQSRRRRRSRPEVGYLRERVI